MSSASPTVGAPPAQAPRPALPPGARILRVLGWTLITAGLVVLLYLVYSLFFTSLETSAAQAQLLERWEQEVGTGALPPADPVEEPTPTAPTPEPVEEVAEPELGSATALIRFVRPGSDEPPVRADPLLVVEGVSVAALQKGPGHYPDSALPGAAGNFAVAGHRTTYGAPFYNLDQLVAGDEVHATGRDGVTHVYVVREQRVVSPFDVWVVEPDPLETGRPTLTLTTCNPRFSNAQRLVVFAELVG